MTSIMAATPREIQTSSFMMVSVNAGEYNIILLLEVLFILTRCEKYGYLNYPRQESNLQLPAISGFLAKILALFLPHQ